MGAPRIATAGRVPLSRRRLLGGAGVAAGAVTASWLTGCTGSGETAGPGGPASGGGESTGEVTWWDQFRPLDATFESDLFAPFSEANPEVTVARRTFDAPSLGQALQLGRRSNQLPDVHSLAGLDSAPASLVGSDWFQPIDEFVDVDSLPVAGEIYDGIHRFDGRVYSLPVFSGRVHAAVPWLNTELAEQAGLDPAEQPASWDDYRAALRRLQEETDDGVHGILVPTQEPPYLVEILTRLAQSAGSAGPIDPRTGEYAFASQPFLDAMELLRALQSDGVVHPASASLGQRDARARWAAGEAGVYMWGSWFIGGLLVQEPEAVDRGLACWQLPTADGGPATFYSAPGGGTFWVSSQAQRAQLGAEVMAAMFDPEFMAALAGAMDAPPVLADVVAEADVHPAYRANVENYTRDVRTAPVPESRNAAVARVLVEMRPVEPGLGEIAQAALTDPSSDYASALRTLSEQMTAERDRAIETVTADGGEVSVADWVFDDWVAGEDYRP